MKIKSLWIEKYFVLQDIHLSFTASDIFGEQNYQLTVFAGLNGSGKSTVLRAITEIYSALRSSQPCPFNFKMVYELSDGKEIEVFQKNGEGESELKMIQLKPSRQEFSGIELGLLPQNLVVYTTGLETHWQQLETKGNQERLAQSAKQEILDDPVKRSVYEIAVIPTKVIVEKTDIPDFYLFRKECAVLATLCGLLREDHQDFLNHILPYLGLDSMLGFVLTFQIHEALTDDDTFRLLAPLADEHIQLGAVHKLVFNLDTNQDLIDNLKKSFSNFFNLFTNLEKNLTIGDAGIPTLQDVRLFFRKKEGLQKDEQEVETALKMFSFIPYSWLSDGEQSFLSRMAMLALLDMKDSLILLDEPEVHFNDFWKREIVSLLDEVLKDSQNHLLMSTHSSILLSDAPIGNVIYFEKENGLTKAFIPNIPIFGNDPGRILVNLFGAENTKGVSQHKKLAWALENLDNESLRNLQENLEIGYWYYRIENKLKGK